MVPLSELACKYLRAETRVRCGEVEARERAVCWRAAMVQEGAAPGRAQDLQLGEVGELERDGAAERVSIQGPARSDAGAVW